MSAAGVDTLDDIRLDPVWDKMRCAEGVGSGFQDMNDDELITATAYVLAYRMRCAGGLRAARWLCFPI